jgi:hypothetical protein
MSTCAIAHRHTYVFATVTAIRTGCELRSTTTSKPYRPHLEDERRHIRPTSHCSDADSLAFRTRGPAPKSP